MESADDVEFGDFVATLLRRVFVDLLVTHLPGVGFAGKRRKAAELAVIGIHTDIGGVDMPVDIEEYLVAVQAATHLVSQPAQMQNVGSGEAEHRVVGIKSNSIAHLGSEIPQRRRKGVGLKRAIH